MKGNKLNQDIIINGLDEKGRGFYRVEVEEIVDSTNCIVHDRGARGEAQGLCVIAGEQTNGRGRRGRSFYSPSGSGLYMSLLLRPLFPLDRAAVLLTTAAAVAGARAAEEACPFLSHGDVAIKWVNDLILREKKCCGILTESFLTAEGALSYAVLGVGFNLCPPEGGWPPELLATAGSLYEEQPPKDAGNRLASAFLNAFLPLYQAMPAADHLAEYRSRQWAVGRDADVLQADGSRQSARVLGVDDDFRLLVQMEGAAEPVALDSGEISVKVR